MNQFTVFSIRNYDKKSVLFLTKKHYLREVVFRDFLNYHIFLFNTKIFTVFLINFKEHIVLINKNLFKNFRF